MSRTQKRFSLGILIACLMALLFAVPGYVARLNAFEGCHPEACHIWSEGSGLDDIFLAWWFECDSPHCAECGMGT